MFSMLGASIWLPFLPMLPVQILLNNLLYDFSQIGIPSDKVDEEYLETPRKWNIASIRRFMMYIGPISSIFDYATFFLMMYGFNCVLFKTLSGGDAAYYEKLFHTGWFVESIITQTLIVHVIRTRKIPFLQSLASPVLLTTTVIAMVIGAALPYIKTVANFLGMVPLPLVYWYWIAGFVLSYVILTHLVKTWFFKKYGVD